MYAIAGTIDLAARNPFVTLHQIEPVLPNLAEGGTRESPVPQDASHVRRIATQDRQRIALPTPRDQRDLVPLLLEQREECADKSFPTAVHAVLLPHQRHTNRCRARRPYRIRVKQLHG
jgi:hypothetical protein